MKTYVDTLVSDSAVAHIQFSYASVIDHRTRYVIYHLLVKGLSGYLVYC